MTTLVVRSIGLLTFSSSGHGKMATYDFGPNSNYKFKTYRSSECSRQMVLRGGACCFCDNPHSACSNVHASCRRRSRAEPRPSK